MANPRKRVPGNAPGDFFVDSTCIDCDTCRQIAPQVFGEAPGTSFVKAQPVAGAGRRVALQALLACPTGSIGDLGDDDVKAVMKVFPLAVEEPVYCCGYNSPKSYGGNSYFVRHAASRGAAARRRDACRGRAAGRVDATWGLLKDCNRMRRIALGAASSAGRTPGAGDDPSGPGRVSKKEIEDALAHGWVVENIEPSR